MWEYINRKRGKKQKKSDNIEKEVWREHFMHPSRRNRDTDWKKIKEGKRRI